MRCDEFEDRWNTYLDDRQSPRADGMLRDHAEQCLPCRVLWDGFDAVETGLELAEIPTLSLDFATRVAALVTLPAMPIEVSPQQAPQITLAGKASAQRQGSWAARFAAPLALGLAVGCIAVGFAAWRISGGRANNENALPLALAANDASQQSSSADNQTQEPLPGVPPAAPRFVFIMGDDGRMIQVDAEEVMQRIGVMSASWPRVGAALVDPELAAAESDSEWVGHVAGQLRPLTTPVTGTLRVLRSSFSMRGNDAPAPEPKPQALRWDESRSSGMLV